MVATTTPMTVAEFRSLPEDSGPLYHELRHGQVVAVTRPKLKHALVQRNLRRLLEVLAEPGSLVDVEVAFRPLPEYELWVADVAYLSSARFQEADPEDNICGAPDIVIEVLSPSNSSAGIADKRKICLSNGSREFWIVDSDRHEVEVWTADGSCMTYRSGEQIELSIPVGAILVDAILLLN